MRREIDNLDPVMSTNIKYNKVNIIIDNEMKFDRDGKKSRHTLNSGLTYLLDSGATDSMIKCKHINNYKSKLRANKVEYITAAVPYTTTHSVKVPFSMPYFLAEKL